MENMDNSIPLLFIKEEGAEPGREIVMKTDDNKAQSGLNFSGAELNQSTLIRPYLEEMDDLLRSCEELTSISFGTVYSESFAETSLNNSSHIQSTDDILKASYRETIPPFQTYLCLATEMDETDTKEQQEKENTPKGLLEKSRKGSDKNELPVSAAGQKLSQAMLDCEDRLQGLLTALEGAVKETGMDFEIQDWNGNAGQEYVHISKGATAAEFEPQPLQFRACAEQHEEGARSPGEGVSKNIRNEVTEIIGKQQQNSQLYSDYLGGILMDSVEESGQNKQAVSEPQFSISGPLGSGDNKEETKTVDMFELEIKKNVSKTVEEDMEMLDEETKVKTDATDVNEFEKLGSLMEECIQKVQHLKKRRGELLAEVLDLRGNTNREDEEQNTVEWTYEQIDRKITELTKVLQSEEQQRREERKEELCMLRKERAEEERRMWKVNLERMGLQEELRRLKRQLFTIMRECTHCQSILKNQCKDVELLRKEEEKLQALVLQLMEEFSQLRSAHNQQILELQMQLKSKLSSQTSSNQEELTECKQNSCGDIQQYLQEGLKFLENRYEPLLLALLKRRDATAGALVKAKEESRQLKSQLRPLRDEIQKVNLQRACLEEKLQLIYVHHKEEIWHYKETVCSLEERCRDLKTELQILKRKNKDLEELRDNYKKQVIVYRTSIEQHKESKPEMKT